MPYSLPIFVFDEFNDQTALMVVYSLMFYEESYGDEAFIKEPSDSNYKSENFPVKIFINSPGGAVLDLMAMIDAMNNVKKDVETYCLGMAASCGAVLLSNGTKGKRYIGKNSHVLLHQISTVAYGNITDINIQTEFANKLNEQLISILAKNCKKSKAQVKADLERDLWMNAEEALEYGLVDKILDEGSNEIKHIQENSEMKMFVCDAQADMEKKIANLEKEKKTFSFEIKSMTEDDNNFYFSGYPSVFNTVDKLNDVIHKGAFTRSLKTSKVMNKSNERALLCLHNIAELPIGKVQLVEDEYGLRCDATLPKEDTFVSGRVLPQMRIGSIQRMSIGFKTIDAYYQKNVRHITDVELYEVSIVIIAAHDGALIESKSGDGDNTRFETMTDISRFLKDKGCSKKDTDDVINRIKLFHSCKENETSDPCKEDPTSTFISMSDVVSELTEIVNKFKNR